MNKRIALLFAFAGLLIFAACRKAPTAPKLELISESGYYNVDRDQARQDSFLIGAIATLQNDGDPLLDSFQLTVSYDSGAEELIKGVRLAGPLSTRFRFEYRGLPRNRPGTEVYTFRVRNRDGAENAKQILFNVK